MQNTALIDNIVNTIECSALRTKLVAAACVVNATSIDTTDLNFLGISKLSLNNARLVMNELRNKYKEQYWKERLICLIYEINTLDELVTIIGDYVLNYEQTEGLLNILKNRLNERQRSFLLCKVRYGMTLEQTATKYGLTSKETIRQTIDKALRILRHPTYKIFYTQGLTAGLNRKKELDELRAKASRTFEEQAAELRNTPDIRAITLDKLDLSVRTYNSLCRNGIKTVGDMKNQKQLLALRNFGQTSLLEVICKLRLLGIELPKY